MITSHDFPHLLPDNHWPTSPATTAYDCVAWAAGDTEHCWQPGKDVDIEHNHPSDVAGGVYGERVDIMSRPA